MDSQNLSICTHIRIEIRALTLNGDAVCTLSAGMYSGYGIGRLPEGQYQCKLSQLWSCEIKLTLQLLAQRPSSIAPSRFSSWDVYERKYRAVVSASREGSQNSPRGFPSPSDGGIGRSSPTSAPAISGLGPPLLYLASGTAFNDSCEDGTRVLNPSEGSRRTARILAMLVFCVNLPIDWTGHRFCWGKTKSCNSLFDFPSLHQRNYHKRKGV